MRIKEIKINGIRGFNYLKDETGNPLPHLIELNEKHLFLYGENGTGKSSLFDAIEWCFTGEIEESHSRKIQNPKDFLVNKFCDVKDNPFVEVLFIKKNTEEVFSRQIKKTKNPSFEYENEARECFIESNRIDNFVIDTKASLWQRFSDLLGFGSLILFDKQLLKLQNESKNQYTDIEKQLQSKKDEIKIIDEKIGQMETNFKKELEEEWEGIVNQEKENNEYKRYNKLDELSKCIKDYFKTYEKIEELYKIQNEKETLLLEERSITSTAEISKIVDEAYKYFINSPYLDACPVCGQKIKFSEVCIHLKNLKASLSNVLDLENELTKITRDIDDSNNILSNSTKEIRKLYGELFEEEIKEPCSRVYLFEFLKTKEVQVDTEKVKLDKTVPMLKKIGIYQEKKNNLTKLKKSLEEIEDELKIKKRICEDIEKFYKLYFSKYSTKIKEELEVISKNGVTRIYNAINQSNDEIVENFIIEPNLESKEITFLAEIRGTSQKVSAIEFLSTGHLRCLGFALLMARIKAKTNTLNFIVIDDPVYSIDHEHRYNLIHYLNELGNHTN